MKASLVAGLNTDATHDGLDDLVHSLVGMAIPSVVYDWDDNDLPFGMDISIDHSFGCCAVFRMLKKNPTMRLKLWVLIDPVDYFWQNNFTIPTAQVDNAICFQRKNPWLPPSRLILNPSSNPPGFYKNYINIPASHHDMPSNPIVVSTILAAVKALL